MKRLILAAFLALAPVVVRAQTSAMTAAAPPLGSAVIASCSQGVPTLVQGKCLVSDIASVATALSLQKAANVADLTNSATARANLGVDAPGTDTAYNFRTNNGTEFASPSAALDAVSGLPHVATKTALAALAHTVYPVVVRDGYAAAGDAPPLAYTPGASACSLNSGAGDGGSQVPTSDGGCWNATFPTGPVNPRWWGAKCDGATNDTAAFGKTEAYLESLFGGAASVPNGACVAAVTIAANNITWGGTARSSEGLGGSRLISPGLTTPVFTIGAVSAITIKDMTVRSASQQTAGALIAMNGGNDLNFDNVFVWHAYDSYDIQNVNLVRINGGGSEDFSNRSVYIYGSNLLGGDIYITKWFSDEENNTYTPRAGIEILQSQGAITIGPAVEDIHGHNDLLIDPGAGQSVSWVYVDNTYFDSCDYAGAGKGGNGVDVVPTGGGIVDGLTFTAVWSSTCFRNFNLAADSSSVLTGVRIANLESLNASQATIYTTYATDVTISNPIIAGGSQASSGTHPAIDLDTGTNHVVITGGRVGAPVENFTATMSYALKLESGFSGTLTVSGLDATGNATGGLLNSSSSTTSTIVNSPGINPLGVAVLSPRASPWTYRAGTSPETFDILSGTITSAAYASGGTLCTTAPCVVPLSPNQTVRVTYPGAAPTVITNRQ